MERADEEKRVRREATAVFVSAAGGQKMLLECGNGRLEETVDQSAADFVGLFRREAGRLGEELGQQVAGQKVDQRGDHGRVFLICIIKIKDINKIIIY